MTRLSISGVGIRGYGALLNHEALMHDDILLPKC